MLKRMSQPPKTWEEKESERLERKADRLLGHPKPKKKRCCNMPKQSINGEIMTVNGVIITDKEKMVLTPTYYIFKMYLPFQDATFVPVTFNAGTYTHDNVTLPGVDAIAAKDKAGNLWLEITNVDPNQSVEVEVSLDRFTARSASGETLTAPKVDSINTFDAPNVVAPKPITARVQSGKLILNLEPKSVSVVSVEK